MQHLPSFEYEQKDLGTDWVVANIPVPPKVRHDVVIVIGYRKKGLHGIMLPSPIPDPEHSSMSFILKWPTGTFPAEWHAQQTPRDAKRFLEETFPWLEVPEDAAARLKAQRPARGFELKCSQYHDPRGQAVLIGDAAHCSGPNLGQGCNIGMQDAAALAQLLADMVKTRATPFSFDPLRTVKDAGRSRTSAAARGHGGAGVSTWRNRGNYRACWSASPALRVPEGHALSCFNFVPVAFRLLFRPPEPESCSLQEEPGQLPGVLERYSALRVPEGHALVDLSESQNAASDFLYAMSSVRTIVQSTLHKWVPWLVSNSIFGLGVSPMPLTSIYQRHKAWVDRTVESNRRHRLSRTIGSTQDERREGLPFLKLS
ncbi:hypothetical protein KFL_002980120 [Klebsormidium nitens]|uniref:FAD-binding domain-containing protein n=1 Tax=Klebsormidium nitens TaxID=105231 RepID=A0A1Y1IAY7_KLENI|nr:hypothetical protein KFL_002980120 [Klebsormidium nitens]|eukprot:GAQ86589.1 hypothetical protein KFL_002980120 [Klebsormidium nitens]